MTFSSHHLVLSTNNDTHNTFVADGCHSSDPSVETLNNTCPVCNQLCATNMEIHVEECLDNQLCPICGCNYKDWTDAERHRHVNTCLDMSMNTCRRYVDVDPSSTKVSRVETECIDHVENTFECLDDTSPGTNLISNNKSMNPYKAKSTMVQDKKKSLVPQKRNSEINIIPRKQCPDYKFIANTTFTVDAFSYGAIPNCTAYFLTHFHSDHYIGLSSKFDHGLVYCTPVTAALVRHELGVKHEFMVEVPLERLVNVQGVDVVFIDANHCPGAAIIVFDVPVQGQRLRYLHTGDFRADHAHYAHNLIRSPYRFESVYLDTTYCDTNYTFPPQQVVLDIVKLLVTKTCIDHIPVSRVISGDPLGTFITRTPKAKAQEFVSGLTKWLGRARERRVLVVVGTYLIGKERVFMAAANALS